MSRVVICMPVFNEQNGISSLVEELLNSDLDDDLSVFVIDDCSTDQTLSRLISLNQRFGSKFTFEINPVNLGHGPTTMKCLAGALAKDPDYIIAVDGDGQFITKELIELLGIAKSSNLDVLEGVRCGRIDPYYRKILSRLLRWFVSFWTLQVVHDANTPLRIYRYRPLEAIVATVPEDAITPNLLISYLTRLSNFKFAEHDFISIPRRGGDDLGSSWNKNRFSAFIPSKRLVSFCGKALRRFLRDFCVIRGLRLE